VWRAVRETTKKKLERKTVAAIDCLNWQEVKKRICSHYAAQLCPNIPPTLKEHA